MIARTDVDLAQAAGDHRGDADCSLPAVSYVEHVICVPSVI
jgi:hypothetical protein